MRLGCDLLAPAARLAGRRGLGSTARGVAGATGPGRSPGLEPSQHRFTQRRCKKGGPQTGPNPTDRGRPGTKHHIVVDAQGIPLAACLSPANRHDSKMLASTLDAVPPIRNGRRGHPRRRPAKLHADKGYDHAFCRAACTARRIQHRIARRGIDSSQRLGRHRWVVERTFAWLARMRRLAIRYERRADIHFAFLKLGCALICWNYVRKL